MKQELLRYGIGGATAFGIALIAFSVATSAIQEPILVAAILLSLAVAQTIAQLVFFLHLGAEAKPRWQSTTIIFTTIMLLIVVIGSLWIMRNLDYRMNMAPEQMQEYMLEQNKKGF